MSGTIEGVEYFKCDPGYAVFVAMDKLIKPPEKATKPNKFLKHQKGSASNFTGIKEVATRCPSLPNLLYEETPSPVCDHKQHIDLPAAIMQLTVKPLSNKSHLIGSKVFFTDKHHNSVSGTVRWIGENVVDAAEYFGVEAVSQYSAE